MYSTCSTRRLTRARWADGEGRLIDCKNIVFFLTSNLGYQVIVEHADDPETMQEALYPVLADFFKPALLARMEVVPYLPLSKETLATIIAGKLAAWITCCAAALARTWLLGRK